MGQRRMTSKFIMIPLHLEHSWGELASPFSSPTILLLFEYFLTN